MSTAPLISMPVTPATPMEMLNRALMSGAAPETLEKLLILQERWEQNQLRKTFDAAIAAAKAKIGPIKKNRTVSFGAGKTAYQHEDLAEIERTIMPILSEYGVGYRFRTTVTDKSIVVTCILFKDGYREENSLPGPADTSGSKNAIQAIGSTVTYLQRYTLKAALGLSASDDDDAASTGPQSSDDFFVTKEQITDLEKLIKKTGRPVTRFCLKFNIDKIEQLPASSYKDAVLFLEHIISVETPKAL